MSILGTPARRIGEAGSTHSPRAPAAFLGRAVAWYRARGIRVERVLTDNGSAYRSSLYALACRRVGLSHLRTRPYRPRTNGKAERFIRTLLHEWAYARLYRDSEERLAVLP